MAVKVFVASVLVLVLPAGATVSRGLAVTDARTDSLKNPIRRVVTMLQKMAEKVEKDGEKEKELYLKFSCYCKTNKADLSTSIAENQAKGPQTQADIEAGESEQKQLEIDLKSHAEDRTAAKQAIAAATAQRKGEHAQYAETSGEHKTYIKALSAAIPAIEKGMAGGFLQAASSTLQRQLKRAVSSSSSATEYDRESVLAFLGQTRSNNGYIPASGEITGILKEIKANFEKNLAEVEAAEADAVKIHEDLMAAKTKQVQTLSDSIEKKTSRSGELAVNIVTMKNDLSEAAAALLEDQKFAAELEKGCGSKDAEWEERQKTRGEELVAIHDTIKILNDDDALELFKKTVGESSLLQVETNMHQVQQHALAQLRLRVDRPRMDFLALALRGKKVDFTKVHQMIDNMVALLAQEQEDDDKKNDYCDKQLVATEDKNKELKKKVEDLGTEIADSEELISTYAADLKALEKGISELDKSVAQATENRKVEHDEFSELMSSNTAAKDILNFAKNRLNKFYNPKLYEAPPKQELSEEDRIAQGFSFVQVVAHRAEPPPSTWDGGYTNKGQETSGVISMVDLLIRDLTKEMTVAETEEKNAQKDYEDLMQDAAGKRAADLKSVQGKEMAKANAEEAKSAAAKSSGEESKELMATQQYGMQLHQECDWLQQNHDIRKEARAQETDSLKQAKAILSGADFSLAQMQRVPIQAGADFSFVQRRLRGGRGTAGVDINQKVYIENAPVFGDGAGQTLGVCTNFASSHVANAAAPTVKVCGTGIKATIYLRGDPAAHNEGNACTSYYQYQWQVGKCDKTMPADTCDVMSPAIDSKVGAAQAYIIEQC